jgi:peroxiredoxin
MMEGYDLIWSDQWKCNIWTPNDITFEIIRDKWQKMGSVEYQAAYTVWSKYKRWKELTGEHLRQLVRHSFILSDERKVKGKVPNKDFLTQEIGKYLKTLI